jgi:hypothetical protein
LITLHQRWPWLNKAKKEEIEKKHQATEKAIDRSSSLSALEELKKQNKELYNQITNNNL